MGQLFKEHQIALSAAATADFKALLNEVRAFTQGRNLAQMHADTDYVRCVRAFCEYRLRLLLPLLKPLLLTSYCHCLTCAAMHCSQVSMLTVTAEPHILISNMISGHYSHLAVPNGPADVAAASAPRLSGRRAKSRADALPGGRGTDVRRPALQ